MPQAWSATDYAANAAFVPQLGASILERLAPKPGERILDLGCGDGVLTEKIIAAGAVVVGVDSSPEMVQAARSRGLDARLMNATALSFESEFDAVFSNAVLHWEPDADAVLAGVFRALKSGGRLVAELGGHGNIAAISVAIRAVLEHRGIAYQWPWYYPTVAEYRTRLQAQHFRIDDVVLFSRATPLPTGMSGWLRTFAGSLLGGLPDPRRAEIESEIVDLVAPTLRDESGNWTADYVRLQVMASKLHLPPRREEEQERPDLKEVQMKNIQLASIAAAAMFSVTTIAAQSQTPAAGSAQPKAMGEKVTVTGCIERADQVTPAGSTAGTSVDSLDFVLIKAPEGTAASATGAATAKSEPNPTGTTGSAANAAMPLYRLQAEVGKLNPHVGHKVEVVGMRDAAGMSAPQTPGAANSNVGGANAPHLMVESVKMLAQSCGR